MLFCWRSNCEDHTGEKVGPLFTWLDLNEIANLISEKGINRNHESILTIDTCVTSAHPTRENEEKHFSKWHKL